MSVATIDNTRVTQHRVTEQSESLENIEYTHKSSTTGRESKEKQHQSSSSTNTSTPKFWDNFARFCCCCCLCLCCSEDSDSDHGNCCCCCGDGCCDD
jgi:hypothetical protein